MEPWLDPSLHARLAGFARRFVNDRHAAEDVAQEALARACTSAGSLREGERAEAWKTLKSLISLSPFVERSRGGALRSRAKTYALMLTGLGLLALWSRRRKQPVAAA